MKTKRVHVWLVSAALLISIAATYYATAYYIPSVRERAFLSRMEALLIEGNGSFKLTDLIDAQWDHVDIIVQPDDSFSESSVLEFVTDRGYGFNALDTLYVPRPFKREYESVFIFTKTGHLVSVVRLDTREIRVKDATYFFNPIIQDSDDYIAAVQDVKNARQWITDRLGVKREGKLTFYKPKGE